MRTITAYGLFKELEGSIITDGTAEHDMAVLRAIMTYDELADALISDLIKAYKHSALSEEGTPAWLCAGSIKEILTKLRNQLTQILENER